MRARARRISIVSSRMRDLTVEQRPEFRAAGRCSGIDRVPLGDRAGQLLRSTPRISGNPSSAGVIIISDSPRGCGVAGLHLLGACTNGVADARQHLEGIVVRLGIGKRHETLAVDWIEASRIGILEPGHIESAIGSEPPRDRRNTTGDAVQAAVARRVPQISRIETPAARLRDRIPELKR